MLALPGCSLPQTSEVCGAEGAIEKAIAGASVFAPDHPAMVGTDGAGVIHITKCAHNGEHVDIAVLRGVRGLVKLAITGAAHVSAVHEMQSAALSDISNDCRQVVVRAGAQ